MFVKRCALLAFALLCATVSLKAQENPRFEVFGGYSYGQLNPGGRLVAQTNPEGKHFGLSGWHAAVQTRVYKNLGFVVDLTGYAGTSDVELAAEHSRYNSYLAGPQYNFRKLGNLNLFAHGLVGVARDRVYLKTGNPLDDQNVTRFAGAFGGGVDVGLTKHVAIRAIEADYILNSFPNLDSSGQIIGAHQANARVSAGIVFRFGGR
jgi:hypothetical protein